MERTLSSRHSCWVEQLGSLGILLPLLLSLVMIQESWGNRDREMEQEEIKREQKSRKSVKWIWGRIFVWVIRFSAEHNVPLSLYYLIAFVEELQKEDKQGKRLTLRSGMLCLLQIYCFWVYRSILTNLEEAFIEIWRATVKAACRDVLHSYTVHIFISPLWVLTIWRHFSQHARWRHACVHSRWWHCTVYKGPTNTQHTASWATLHNPNSIRWHEMIVTTPLPF